MGMPVKKIKAVLIREGGLTLTEVLIAMAVFMLIISPIFSVFRSSKTQVNASQERLTAFLIGRKVIDSIRGALYNSGAVRLSFIVPQLGETSASAVNNGGGGTQPSDGFNFIRLSGGEVSRYFVKLMDVDNNGMQDDGGIRPEFDKDLYDKLSQYKITVVTSNYSTGFFGTPSPDGAGFIADEMPYSNPDPDLCLVNVTVDWTSREGQEKAVRLSSLVTTNCPFSTPPGEDDRPPGALEGF